tara:strand:+ start:1231 stop:1452 length:222 start_codon:yes stop_codon:yes gene_type:complete
MIYCILNIESLNDVNYSEVIEDSTLTVRKNEDNTEFIISFPETDIPEIAVPLEKYTHKIILEIISSPLNKWIY